MYDFFQHFDLNRTVYFLSLVCLNGFTRRKNSASSKLKARADDKLYVTQIIKSVFRRTGNIVGKGENAGDQHFLLFPQYFLQAVFS